MAADERSAARRMPGAKSDKEFRYETGNATHSPFVVGDVDSRDGGCHVGDPAGSGGGAGEYAPGWPDRRGGRQRHGPHPRVPGSGDEASVLVADGSGQDRIRLLIQNHPSGVADTGIAIRSASGMAMMRLGLVAQDPELPCATARFRQPPAARRERSRSHSAAGG